jgi:predicted amidohydrolase
MRVGVVQHDIVWEDREATLAQITPRVTSLAKAGAELVALPEMFGVGFSMDTTKVAEDPGGPTETWLRAQAAEHGIWVGGSAPVRVAGGGVRNRFLLAGPDGRVLTYDKVKPFTHGGEAEHYEAGDGTTTWDVGGLRVTPFVCYDLRFAPLWWERAPDTDLYLCVASWPARRAAHWRSLLVARAVENQAAVIGCNRIGEGGGLSYAGGSIAVDALGHVLEDASTADTGFVVLVDPAQTAQVRASLPFLADR